MNPYRQKFLEDMVLKGFSLETQKSYTYKVNAFFVQSNLGKLPEDVTEEDMRKYFLYLKNERHYSVAALKAALWALSFFLRTRCLVIGLSLI